MSGVSDPAEADRYHLVGVAGVGMSAIAQALVGRGYQVSGSDRYLDTGAALSILQQLAAAGVRLVAQDGKEPAATRPIVVVSTAIETDNPDVAAARAAGCEIRHRAAVLAQLAENRRSIAVTGTSGKSTVTGLIGWILTRAGWDPTVVNGAPVLNWASADCVGNYRGGQSDWFVFEADESDRSLSHYVPYKGVVTNVSRDHFEMDETIDLFAAFWSRVAAGGVNCLNQPALLEGLAIERQGQETTVRVADLTFRTRLPGRHNAENTAVAALLCRDLGMPDAQIRDGIESFAGIQRRLQRVNAGDRIPVYDDYAHNPAKLAATWMALAEQHDRVCGIWRPHGYGPLRMMLGDLTETFATVCRPQDVLFVLPVYDAGGTADRSVSPQDLVAALMARGVSAAMVEEDAVLASAATGRRCGELASVRSRYRSSRPGSTVGQGRQRDGHGLTRILRGHRGALHAAAGQDVGQVNQTAQQAPDEKHHVHDQG